MESPTSASHDVEYLTLCSLVLHEGEVRSDRTGTGALSIFSHQMRFDMANGFPLLTTKDMTQSFEHIKAELLWMLAGSTNAHKLANNGFKIWTKWQKNEDGDLGRIYGAQWRSFRSWRLEPEGRIRLLEDDQITRVLTELQRDPYSRRLLVSAWNSAELADMALPPCHWSFELYVSGPDQNVLNLKLNQRSCDVFLGVPYNIAEYALLLHALAFVLGMEPGTLVHNMTNVHIYLNHVDQVREQLTREPRPSPTLDIVRWADDIFSFTKDHFDISDYNPHPKLTGEVSV